MPMRNPPIHPRLTQPVAAQMKHPGKTPTPSSTIGPGRARWPSSTWRSQRQTASQAARQRFHRRPLGLGVEVHQRHPLARGGEAGEQVSVGRSPRGISCRCEDRTGSAGWWRRTFRPRTSAAPPPPPPPPPPRPRPRDLHRQRRDLGPLRHDTHPDPKTRLIAASPRFSNRLLADPCSWRVGHRSDRRWLPRDPADTPDMMISLSTSARMSVHRRMRPA